MSDQSCLLVIKGPPFNLQGGGQLILLRINYLFKPGSGRALNFKLYYMFIYKRP